MPKKKQGKKPKGWRPGRTPKFKPHPSVKVYRDPDVRSGVNLGIMDGHTHARFVANPDCCPICQALDGKVFRAETVSNWIYTTVHPNCFCHWETGYMSDGEFSYEKGESVDALDDEMSEFEFQHEAPAYFIKADSPPTAAPGLVQKDVVVHRKGKTFTEKRMVREGDIKKETPSSPKGPSNDSPMFPPKAEQAVVKHEKEVTKVRPGEKKQIGKVMVEGLKDGFFGLTVSGKKLLVHGSKASAIILDYASRAGASVGSLAVGDVSEQGARGSVSEGKSVSGAVHKVAAVVQADVAKKENQARLEVAKKKKDAESKAKAQ